MSEKRLIENLNQVRDRIARAETASSRPPGSVTLVAVTKRTPAAWARSLATLGQFDLGENYPQELWTKSKELEDAPIIRWHAIGHLQTNKLKRTLPLVSMIHAVDSLRLLEELATQIDQAPGLQRVCLQVNLSGEASKHGWTSDTILVDFPKIMEILQTSSVPVTGLMTMAALGTDTDSARPTFAALRTLRDDLNVKFGLKLTDLSMGMSGDFEAAIAEGATHVRVGSLLFEGMSTT
jgi:pyridoxal phosphate enzyme (YggS family)